jgi:hypothetical protein
MIGATCRSTKRRCWSFFDLPGKLSAIVAPVTDTWRRWSVASPKEPFCSAYCLLPGRTKLMQRMRSITDITCSRESGSRCSPSSMRRRSAGIARMSSASRSPFFSSRARTCAAE